MIVYRYITKELVLGFTISIVGLNLLLMMEKVLRLSLLITGAGASYTDIIKLLLLIQPQLLMLTVPMAFLLSVLLTYGRMGLDSELTVLRSSGMSFHDLARPVFLLAGFLFLLSLLITFYLLPGSSKKLRGSVNRLLREQAPLAIEPGVFFTHFKGILILVEEKTGPHKLKGVFIYDGRDKAYEKVIYAREGILTVGMNSNPSFRLVQGTVHMVGEDSSTEVHFDEYLFSIRISGGLLGRKKSEMSLAELYTQGRKGKKEGLDYLIEFHRRLSFPALSLALSFLAVPLAFVAGRRGRVLAFIAGILVFTLYYVVLIYFENLVRSGVIPHYMCWIPLCLLGIAGLVLYKRGERL
jgi:lipopolysaccharide export system permease protein